MNDLINTFASIVITCNFFSEDTESEIKHLCDNARKLFVEFEVIAVCNGLCMEALKGYHHLADSTQIENTRFLILSEEVDSRQAQWVGITNSIGDFILIPDTRCFDCRHWVDAATSLLEGSDIVILPSPKKLLAWHEILKKKTYIVLSWTMFHITGIKMPSQSTSIVAISRRLVGYLEHLPRPHLRLKSILSIKGLRIKVISTPQEGVQLKNPPIVESIIRGIQIGISGSAAPLRLVYAASFTIAFISLLYSAYILVTWVFGKNVEPGWASLSLQLSGLYFVVSLVFIVLSEYIIEMRRALSPTNFTPYIMDELYSKRRSWDKRLNLEMKDNRCHDRVRLNADTGSSDDY